MTQEVVELTVEYYLAYQNCCKDFWISEGPLGIWVLIKQFTQTLVEVLAPFFAKTVIIIQGESNTYVSSHSKY